MSETVYYTWYSDKLGKWVCSNRFSADSLMETYGLPKNAKGDTPLEAISNYLHKEAMLDHSSCDKDWCRYFTCTRLARMLELDRKKVRRWFENREIPKHNVKFTTRGKRVIAHISREVVESIKIQYGLERAVRVDRQYNKVCCLPRNGDQDD
jgi:hypothetical protein